MTLAACHEPGPTQSPGTVLTRRRFSIAHKVALQFVPPFTSNFTLFALKLRGKKIKTQVSGFPASHAVTLPESWVVPTPRAPEL